MRGWGHPRLIHVVALAVLLAASGLNARTVQLTAGGPLSLSEALRDQAVDTIVVNTDYSIAFDPPGSLPGPIKLQRNVTIRGRVGADVPVKLDLAYRHAGLVLCHTCRISIRDLTLRNARRGTGSALDFIVGDDEVGEAAVLLQDVRRHRLACTPSSSLSDVLEGTPRSKVLPPSPTGEQLFALKTVTVQGVTYPDALHLIDFTEDLPLGHQEGRGQAQSAHWGGYALGARNVVYLCDNVVSESCMADKSPDACVNELIDRLLTSSPQGAGGPPLPAIVAPVMVVGALLATAALYMVYRRRRQRQHRQDEEQQGKLQSFSPFSPGATAGGSSVGGLDSASEYCATSKSQGGRRSLEIATQPQGHQKGWLLVSSATSAFVQQPVGSDCDVEFGAFLGAGSYGRVYRARWAGLDVAVKVIQHDRSTLAAVEAEADLMLTLHHPNVVKAYHYCAFTCSEPLHSEKSRSSRSWSQVGQRQASFTGSQSSGGSAGARTRQQGDSASQLNRTSTQTNSVSNSGSGSSARVLLLRQQQAQLAAQPQQPADSLLQRQESSDVLITNLSVDGQAAQEAVTIASSIAAVSSVTTKGSAGTEPKVLPREASMSGECAGLKSKAETWLVQEYCDLGTLGGIASSWDMQQECDEQMLERLVLLRDTAQGLEALHANLVVHGDINSRNVLVSSCISSEGVDMCAKVADLGLSRCLSLHKTHQTTDSCGTMSHSAPELLRFGRLSPAVDVYAFGIMMWELYHQGQAAFGKLHYGQFFETVVLRKVRPCVPPGMPPDYERVMRQCWAADPADRPPVAVLKQCLQLMVEDRQRRLYAGPAAGPAAPNGPTSSSSSSSGAAAAAASLPGTAVLPALQALLPQTKQPHDHSPAGQQQQGAAAAGTDPSAMPVSPGNSSGPLSDVSLSALFPDSDTPLGSDTVLFIGQEAAAAAAAVPAPTTAAARPVVRPAVRPAVRRVSPVPGVAGSPLGSDVEAQSDPSVHSARVWFV